LEERVISQHGLIVLVNTKQLIPLFDFQTLQNVTNL
jgi:hypothetical protein